MYDFIDFGSGKGASFDFAASISGSLGLAIDKSNLAVTACKERGIPSEQRDIVDYTERNVATGTFAINVLPELPGREAFFRSLENIIRAARDFAILQHSQFDYDGELAIKGAYVRQNFDKKTLFRPLVADYLEFLATRKDSLSLVGMMVQSMGEVSLETLPMADSLRNTENWPAHVPKTLRVVFGRKSVSRFRPAVQKAKAGKQVFHWEKE